MLLCDHQVVSSVHFSLRARAGNYDKADPVTTSPCSFSARSARLCTDGAQGLGIHLSFRTTKYSPEGTRFGYFSCKKSEPQLCGVFIRCLQSLLGGGDLILSVHSSLFINNESCKLITK